jgi:hypothetical protein
MATVKDIKNRLATRLEKVNQEFGPSVAIQLRVEPEELEAILAEGTPEGFQQHKAALTQERRPTHLLLHREEIEQLLHYDPRQKPNSPANVPGQ